MEQNQDYSPKEEKKSNKLGIIILLIVIILGLVGYIVYDKMYLEKKNTPEESNTKVETNTTKEEKKELDINDTTVQKLFTIFTVSNGSYMENINDNNHARLRVAYNNLSLNDIKSIRCDKIENLNENKCKGSNTEYVDSKIMKQKMEELFGSDYSYKEEDFDRTCNSYKGTEEFPCYLMHYDSKNDIYTYLPGECGCDSYVTYKETLLSAYTKGDRLYLNTTLVATFEGEPYQDKNTATKGEYTFKKDTKNGNYVFEKVVLK